MSTDFQKDPSLTQELAAGNERAITIFYKTYGPVLFTICKRYSENQEQAEDFFQEGFMHILAQIHKFNEQASLQTWAYKVMSNFCINQLRKAINKVKWVDVEHASTDGSIDEIYEETERVDIDKVLASMQLMPAGFRLILNMYAIDGKTHAEIAKELKISEGTSKSQLYKARRWLKQKLAESEVKK